MNLDVELRESIVRICGVPADQVTPAATLEDLGVDSLAAAEIITDVEIRAGFELPMDVLRGLNQLRTVGAGHGPLWTGGRPAPASRWAATSPTVRSWLRPRKTSIGSSIPARISTSVMISAAASESTPRSSSVEAGVT